MFAKLLRIKESVYPKKCMWVKKKDPTGAKGRKQLDRALRFRTGARDATGTESALAANSARALIVATSASMREKLSGMETRA